MPRFHPLHPSAFHSASWWLRAESFTQCVLLNLVWYPQPYFLWPLLCIGADCHLHLHLATLLRNAHKYRKQFQRCSGAQPPSDRCASVWGYRYVTAEQHGRPQFPPTACTTNTAHHRPGSWALTPSVPWMEWKLVKDIIKSSSRQIALAYDFIFSNDNQ